jgi:hypothetical protein
MVFEPRGIQLAAMLSDGTEVEWFLQVPGYKLAIRRSIFYRCALFSLRATIIGCCLADLWQRPGTTNGENRFAYSECCLVSLVACFCSQIYAHHTPSISRSQMSALGLCSGCTKGSGGQVDARRSTSIERRCMQVVCWQQGRLCSQSRGAVCVWPGSEGRGCRTQYPLGVG